MAKNEIYVKVDKRKYLAKILNTTKKDVRIRIPELRNLRMTIKKDNIKEYLV